MQRNHFKQHRDLRKQVSKAYTSTSNVRRTTMSHGVDGNAGHGSSDHGSRDHGPGNHSMHSLGNHNGHHSGTHGFVPGTGHHAGSAMHAALGSSSHAASTYGAHSVAMVFWWYGLRRSCHQHGEQLRTRKPRRSRTRRRTRSKQTVPPGTCGSKTSKAPNFWLLMLSVS